MGSEPAPSAITKSLERRLRRLLKPARGPLTVGPWEGDVATEVLYWIPFLRWVVERFAVDPTRLTSVSRGHVAAWYSGIANAYAEVGDGPQESKHPLGRELLSELLDAYWNGDLSTSQLFRYLRVRPLRSEALAPASVPDRYVAIAIEFSPSFPDTRANRHAARAVIERIAKGLPLVLLTPREASARRSIGLGSALAIQELEKASSDRLASVQGAVAARAEMVLGTLGADALALGACHGIPTLGLYGDRASVTSAEIDALGKTARMLGASFSLVNVSVAGAIPRLAAHRARRRISLPGRSTG